MAGLEAAGVERAGGESILELEITPNRGDCLSMIGVAREVSALTGNSLRLPVVHLDESKERMGDLIKITLMEERLCPRYTARMVRGVKVGQSPDWLKERLSAADIRPINNVVDVTNYILLELGHPMHAFDYHLLEGGQLLIRRAKEGEKLTTLDGVARKLNEGVLVIADEKRPVAIAGIMGGEDTQVTSNTCDVLLEGAYFDPVSVRRMGRSLGLTTESSYRFERGVDPEGLTLAQEKAAQLIKELAGGEIVSGMVDLYPEPLKRPSIDLRKDQVNKILGTDLSLEEMINILERLYFKFEIRNSKFEILTVEVPSFRHEITREIDLIEEIARIYGYEKIGLALPHKTTLAPRRYMDGICKKTREILTGLGLFEVITFSFIDRASLERLHLNQDAIVAISNPLQDETSLMRTTLIPGLVKTILWNINREVKDIKIFELGRVFSPKKDQALPQEKCNLSGAMTGHYQKPSWRRKDEGISFYELAAVLEDLFKGLGIEGLRLVEGEHFCLCPGRTAVIEVDEKPLGVIGEIDPDIANSFDLPTETYLFEVNFDKIVTLSNLNKSYRPLPKYPAAIRDLAIIVKEEIPSEDILAIIEEIGGGFIERVELFDLYPGERIADKHKGFKSLAYSIVYRDPKATLKDEFVNEIYNRIVSEIEERLGAKLR